MKIALFGGAEYTIPPPKTGIFAPLDVVYLLAEGLTKKGHEVTLFAPKGSQVSARVVDFNMEPLDTIRKKRKIDWEVKTLIAYEQLMISRIYRCLREKDFDIFHSHDPLRTLPFVNLASIPTVMTMHTPVRKTYQIAYEMAISLGSRFYPISISKAQQKNSLRINWFGTVHNGINLLKFLFSKIRGEDLLWVGRIHPDKGTDIAIEVARRSGLSLKLAGAVVPEDEISNLYWEEKIKKMISGKQFQYLGLVPHSKISSLYQNAKALLFPIQWEEPFGLVMIEAMACGTPVIAFGRGSVPEIVKDGRTGFIIEPGDIDGMVKAVKKIDQIDRMACRRHVEENFTIERMVEKYEKIYKKIIKEQSL